MNVSFIVFVMHGGRFVYSSLQIDVFFNMHYRPINLIECNDDILIIKSGYIYD